MLYIFLTIIITQQEQGQRRVTIYIQKIKNVHRSLIQTKPQFTTGNLVLLASLINRQVLRKIDRQVDRKLTAIVVVKVNTRIYIKLIPSLL